MCCGLTLPLSRCPPVSAGPVPPEDPEVRKVVEKLAEFVAKNGRNFEEVTRQRNPEDSPFRHVLWSFPDAQHSTS